MDVLYYEPMNHWYQFKLKIFSKSLAILFQFAPKTQDSFNTGTFIREDFTLQDPTKRGSILIFTSRTAV